MLNKNTLFFLSLIWTIVLTLLSLATIDSSIGEDIKIPNKDKIVHFVFYFLFVFLWSFFVNFDKYISKKAYQILFIAIGYGIMMEIFQSLFTTNREASIFDVIANSIGAIFGMILSKFYFKNKT